jgi:hypothetical protein
MATQVLAREVLGMRAQPQGLMRPDRVLRVLRANLRRQPV